jgi:hypothetical protein
MHDQRRSRGVGQHTVLASQPAAFVVSIVPSETDHDREVPEIRLSVRHRR